MKVKEILSIEKSGLADPMVTIKLSSGEVVVRQILDWEEIYIAPGEELKTTEE